MKKIIPIFALFVVFATAGTSRGETSARDFLEKYDNAKRDTQVWLGTVIAQTYDGMSWVDSWLKTSSETNVFCVPKKLVLTDDQLIDILRRYLKANGNLQDEPFGMVLLYSVIDAFPCN